MNALSAFIPADERTITIEDSAELKFQRRHWVRLEVRPPNTEGVGEVTQRDLVRNCLRMRPDRIIVGEVRGAEVWDMLQAMNTGHDGSLTTIHANSAQDALARLEMMVALTGFELPVSVGAPIHRLRHHVDRAIGPFGRRSAARDAGLRTAARRRRRLRDGRHFRLSNRRASTRREWPKATSMPRGYRPACLARMEAAGIRLPEALFRQTEIAQRPSHPIAL